MFLLLDGRVRVSHLEADGAERIAAMLEEGDLFGVEALVPAEPRSFLAEAIEPVTVIRVSRSAWMEFSTQHEAARVAVMAAIERQGERVRLPSFLSESAD